MVDNISLRFDFLEKKKHLGHQFWNIPENKIERPKIIWLHNFHVECGSCYSKNSDRFWFSMDRLKALPISSLA